jgi:hyperosmotically inducible protein
MIIRSLRGWMMRVVLAGLLGAAIAGCAGGPTTSSTGEYVDDSAITTKIKSRFVADSMVSAFDIHVETFRGTVKLSGFVNTDAQKERAVSIARSTAGVHEVEAAGLTLTPRR